MKGLLKGFRYFTQIFDGKEEEMQIGYPTDVKHVAHIGWDGPSVNPPSWMNEFRSAPLSALGAEAMSNQSPAGVPSDDSNRGPAEVPDSPLRELPDQLVPKPRRQSSASSAMPADSTTGPPSVPRHSRRNKSTTAIPVDQPEGDPPSYSSRRHAGSVGGGSSLISTPTDSPVRDLPSIPKIGRKKKAKAAGGGAPGGGSSRSGKPRAQAPLSDGGEAAGRGGENALVIESSLVQGEGMM